MTPRDPDHTADRVAHALDMVRRHGTDASVALATRHLTNGGFVETDPDDGPQFVAYLGGRTYHVVHLRALHDLVVDVEAELAEHGEHDLVSAYYPSGEWDRILADVGRAAADWLIAEIVAEEDCQSRPYDGPRDPRLVPQP